MSKKQSRRGKAAPAPVTPPPAQPIPAADGGAAAAPRPAPAAPPALPLTRKEVVPVLVLCALLFLTVMFSSSSTIKGIAMILVLIAIVGIFLRRAVLGERFCLPTAAMCLWVIFNGISTLYAVSGKFALMEFLELLLAFSWALLFLAFAKGKGEDLGRGVASILEGAAALAGLFSMDLLSTHFLSSPLLGFLGLFSQDYSGLIGVEVGTRMTSLFGNPNVFAGCAGIGVLLSLGLAITARRKGELRFHLVCLFLNAMSFLLAFSMGGSATIAVAFLIYLLLERRERRGHLLVLMVETGILAIAAAFLVSLSSLDEWTGIQPIPMACAVVGSVLLCLLEERLGRRVGDALAQRAKLIPVLVCVLLAAVALFLVLAFNLTGGTTLQAGETLRRSAYPQPGTYSLALTADAEVNVTIESQNRQDTMMHTSTILYQGAAAEASFTVPEDSLVVYFNFTAPQGTHLEAASYQGEAGSGSIKLGYKLLPSFIANRLQGLFANQNAIQRLVFFEDGLKLFQLNPIFGRGMGGFENGIVSVQSFYYETAYAHNHYIQTLVETGIIGLLLFLATLVTAAIAVLRSRRKADGHPLAPALGAALVFMAAHAGVEVVFSSAPYLPFALGVLALISLCCGETLSLAGLKAKVRAAIPMVLALLMAVYAVLLGCNMYAKSLIQRSPSFDSIATAIRLDRFEWADYMLSYVASARTLGDSQPEIKAQADQYAQRLAQLDSNTVPLYLAEYYFTYGEMEQAMAMLEKYVDYLSADQEAWQSAFAMLYIYQNDSQAFLDGTAHLYQMLQDWNSTNMGQITLSEDIMAWLTGLGIA